MQINNINVTAAVLVADCCGDDKGAMLNVYYTGELSDALDCMDEMLQKLCELNGLQGMQLDWESGMCENELVVSPDGSNALLLQVQCGEDGYNALNGAEERELMV